MNTGNIFFVVCSLICLVGAMITVLAKNPIRGAVGLLATIMGIAGLFLILNAQFLAAIQLIVYAGAVVVLFVFVIMLLGPDAGVGQAVAPRARFSRIVSGSVMVAMALGAFLMIARLPTEKGTAGHAFGPARPEHGTVEAVGQEMFTRAVVPFELATVLLIVAVVGAIAVARSKSHVKVGRAEPNPSKRMFYGEILPDPLRPETLPTSGVKLPVTAEAKEDRS